MTVEANYAPHSYFPGSAMLPEPVPWPFLNAAYLRVTHVAAATGAPTPLVRGVDYNVGGDGPAGAGVITAIGPWPEDDQFLIERVTPPVQPASIPPGEPLPAQDVERSLDRNAMAAQEAGERVGRALVVPAGEAPIVLAPAAASAVPFRFLGRNPVTGALDERDLPDDFRGDPGGNVMAIGLFESASALSIPVGADLVQTSGWSVKGKGIARYAYAEAVDAAYVATHSRTSFISLNGRGFRLAEPVVNVLMCGAAGDGVTDDTISFVAALAVSRTVDVPPGRFFVVNVPVPDFSRIRGAGKSPWEPYDGNAKPAGFLTELVVDGTDAFDCRLSNCVTIEGIGFCSVTGKQSNYRDEPGYQPGSGAIAITGSSAFVARGVSFFGLEFAIHSHLSEASLPGGETISGVETDEALASANTTQMPMLDDWQASDCKRVIAFGNSDSEAYTVRDAKISEAVIALHCGEIIEAYGCDGIRLETVRLYHCTGYSVQIHRSVFVTIVGVTLFENGLGGIYLKACENNLIDVTTARSGDYAIQVPTVPQHTAINLIDCITTFVSGIIEKPTGAAVDIDRCTTTTLSVAIDTPFWKTGNETNASGAINVTESLATTITGSVGGANHWVNVWSDLASQPTLSVALTSHPSTGSVRAYSPGQQGVHVLTLSDDLEIAGSGGVAVIGSLRLLVPRGKLVKLRSVQQTSPTVQLRAVVGGDAVVWATSDEVVTTPGFPPVVVGTISLEDRALYDNTAGPAGYYRIELSLRNSSGAPITVPAGHEVRLSTVLVDP